MPAALEGIDWNVAKAMCAAGMGKPEVANKLGVALDTLKKRARREQWVCTNAILHKARKQQRDSIKALKDDPKVSPLLVPLNANQPQIGAKQAGNGGSGIALLSDSERKASTFLLKELEENASVCKLLGSTIARKGLETASKRKKPIEIRTIQDVRVAQQIAITANGEDRDNGGVTVNLFSPQAGTRPTEAARGFRVRVQEAETLPIAQEGT